MARVELNIVALGDFKSVNTQIANLKTQVELLNKSLVGVGLSSNLQKQLAEANNAFKATMLSTGQFTANTVKLKAETDKFGESLVTGKLKLSEYFKIIKSGTAQATAQMRALALEQTKLQNSIVMADPTKQGVMSVYTPTKINEMTNATKIATNMQNLYNIAVKKGTEGLINWGKNTQWAGRQLTVGMTVPLTIFGNTAMKTFQQVGDEIVRLQKVYGSGLTQPTQQALADIKVQVLSLGKELASGMGIAVKDTAAMAADLAATGLQGVSLINSTREAMRLQKLGEMSTQDAMQTTISLQNVYKLNTEQLSGAVNFLNAVENQTSTSLQDLAAGIPKVGPIVQQLGGSFKDTAVMMVAMKEAGVPAAQSANAIKSAIASLINPSKSAKEAFAGFNINLANIATSTKGNPVQMIMQLQSALKGLAPLAQAQLIEKLFGKFQEARIQALITNLGAVNSQTKVAFDLMNATDSQLSQVASNELKQATESTTGKFKRAVETLKADILPIGEKIMSLATKLLDFGHSISKVFSGLPGPLKFIMGAIAAGVALAGPIIMFTGVLANFVGYVLKAMFGLKNLITGTKTFGELFTPEIIASQNAAELFSTKILEDESAIALLNTAVRELTINLEGMAVAMGLAARTNLGTNMTNIVEKLPGMTEGGFVPGSGNTDSVPMMLTPGELVVPKNIAQDLSRNTPRYRGEMGIQTSGKGSGIRSLLGLVNRSGTSNQLAFDVKENNQLLPTWTVATPSKVYNKQLQAGTASAEEWIGSVGTGGPGNGMRGYEAHSGLSEFLSATNPNEQQNKNILQRVHNKFIENIRKYGKNLSDAAFSEESYRAYDAVINEEFANNEAMMLRYNQEKRNVGGASYQSPTSRSGRNYVGVMSPGTATPDYKKYGSSRRKRFNDQMIESHVFSDEFAGQFMDPAYENKIAVKASTSVIQRIKAKLKIVSKIQSPSKETQIIGQQITEGVAIGMEQAIPKVEAASTNVAQKAIGGLRGKLSGSRSGMGMGAKLGAGMALTMGGSMLSGMLPQGSMASGMLGSAATMGGMGMMFGPQIGLAMAGIGALTSGIKHLMEIEKKHQDQAKATFTASAEAAQFFGKTAQDTANHLGAIPEALVKIAGVSKGLNTQFAEVNSQFSSFSKMVQGLPKDNPLSLLIDNIKGMSNSGAIKTVAQDFVNMQVAIGNVDATKAQTLINLILATAGKTGMIGSVETASNQVSAISNALKSASGDALTFNTAITQIGNRAINTKNYKELQVILKGINSSGINGAKAIEIFGSSVDMAANAKRIESLQRLGYSFADILTLLAASQYMKISIGKNDDPKKVVKEYGDALRGILDKQEAQVASVKAVGKAKQSQLDTTNQQIKALEKEKKKIDEQIAAEQKKTAEIKRQQDYAVGKTDIENQIKQAMATGDYLKANLLRQQMGNMSDQFATAGATTPLQDKSDALAKAIQALQDKSTGISDSLNKLNETIAGIPQQIVNATNKNGGLSVDSVPETVKSNLVSNASKKTLGTQTLNKKTGKLEVTKGSDAKNETLPLPSDETQMHHPKFEAGAEVTGPWSQMDYNGKDRIYKSNGLVYDKSGKKIGRWANTDSIGIMRAYAAGTSYVQQDGPAYLHKGERVVTAKDNKGGWLQKWSDSISGMPGAEIMGTGPLLRMLAGRKKESNFDYLGIASLLGGPASTGIKSFAGFSKLLEAGMASVKTADFAQGLAEQKTNIVKDIKDYSGITNINIPITVNASGTATNADDIGRQVAAHVSRAMNEINVRNAMSGRISKVGGK